MASPDIMIYWGSGSPPCWRVLMVLKEKGLAYKEKICSFGKKEHKSEEVLALNPRGQLPTTKIDSVVINESMAACDYLEGVYGGQGTQLMPTEPAQMAVVLQRKFEALTFIKACGDVYYPIMYSKDTLDKEKLEEKKAALLVELQRWEGFLEEQGNGCYIAGKEVSMADIIFFPNLAFLIRLGMSLSERFPHLGAYYDKMKERPSVKGSWPPHWSEGEGPGVLKDF